MRNIIRAHENQLADRIEEIKNHRDQLIYKLYKDKKYTITELANVFNRSYQRIYQIVLGQTKVKK